MEFNKSYTQYWESAVQKSVDGTVIAGLQEVAHFLDPLGLNRADRILDLGCSTGRMYAALSRYSDALYGTEPDIYAVEKAALQPYQDVRQGTAEKTAYPSEFFDFVFCWAVFDVVDHFDGLMEINRILKNDGRALLTCKADSYDPLDVLAFKAEKNAYLKGFPNKFSNLARLCQQIEVLGFELTDLVTFPRRGDMGVLNYNRHDVEAVLGADPEVAIDGYEYLIVIRKIAVPANLAKGAVASLDAPFSETAQVLARNAGYASAKDYFASIGID